MVGRPSKQMADFAIFRSCSLHRLHFLQTGTEKLHSLVRIAGVPNQVCTDLITGWNLDAADVGVIQKQLTFAQQGAGNSRTDIGLNRTDGVHLQNFLRHKGQVIKQVEQRSLGVPGPDKYRILKVLNSRVFIQKLPVFA